MAAKKSKAVNTMTRKQYAKHAREQAIKRMMSFGYDRKNSEEAFDYTTKLYKKKYNEIDEYSAIIRNANESLYGCGMLDRILTSDDLVKLGKIEPPKSRKDKPVAQRSQKSRSTNGAKVQSEAAARKTGAKVQSRQATPKSAPAVPKTAPAAAKSSQSFTVKAGRTMRTFATKSEAKTYANQCKSRTVTVTPSTRKPTHKIVSFTAKK